MTISNAIEGNEKDLENFLKESIGDIIFPEYLIIGNERSLQKEADLFAIDSEGNLVVFELKVNGQYERSKVYQVLDYTQHFSFWRYDEINSHFKKCFSHGKELSDAFEEHFGFSIDKNEYNRKQKAIIISFSSSNEVHRIARYWKHRGIDIEEYFYRFYKLYDSEHCNPRVYFELSNELAFNQPGYSCWVNTCQTHFPEAFIDMVREKKAATYNGRMEVIGTWMSKGFVFLYHNGYGIIAAGKGTARLVELFNEKYDSDERAIFLSSFISGVNVEEQRIECSITPSRIKEILERDFFFTTSLVGLSEKEGKLLFEECQKIFK
jgi:hypothetical protein